LFFPKIVIAILAVLAAGIAAKTVIVRMRTGRPLFNKDWKFFIPGADFFMLGGSLVIFILYVALMGVIGFLASSLVCIFLYNLLFCRSIKPKSLLVSLASTIIACVAVWYLFAVVFNISLP
jgi:hypothetical protein